MIRFIHLLLCMWCCFCPYNWLSFLGCQVPSNLRADPDPDNIWIKSCFRRNVRTIDFVAAHNARLSKLRVASVTSGTSEKKNEKGRKTSRHESQYFHTWGDAGLLNTKTKRQETGESLLGERYVWCVTAWRRPLTRDHQSPTQQRHRLHSQVVLL